MNINTKKEGSKLTIELEGRLDTVTSPQLDEVIQKEIDSVDEIILDLEKLEYMSSAGLRILLSTEKVMSKKDGMKVIHVNSDIMEIFEITGFSEILTIVQ